MSRYDQLDNMYKKRKGGGWNPISCRRPPMNPQGNYSIILPRVEKASQVSVCGRSECQHDSLRSNIHVIVRIRPKNFNEKGPLHRTIVKALGEHVVIFDPKEDSSEQFYYHGIKQKSRNDYTKKPHKNLKFAYDRVYGPHNTNVEIFETSMKKLVAHILDGFNCSIFAYGATGAGKTYTMLGSIEHPGLTFFMAMELYSRIKGMANEYESEIVVSYLEVYNETLRDLLHPSGILTIREDGFNGVNIPNLTMHKPKDASELLGMLSYGNSVRTQHPTDHNAESSRSHAVFQVFVSLRKRFTHKSLKYKMAKAKLVMVDLAGSERGLGPGCDSQRFREGANINKSLLALSNCINALADGKKHIPYRDSKLTRILKDTLGGNCKTIMIANLSPSLVSYDDTYNTLKYAGRAKEIHLNCKKNLCATETGMTYTKMVNDLQLEIQQLKMELETERDSRKKFETTDTHLQHHEDICDGMFDCAASQGSSSPLLTPTQVISDPVALENFIQLLSQKKKLEEEHAEASVSSKEMQWELQWKRWKLEAAKFAGKPTNPVFRHSLQKMKAQYENLLAKHKSSLEKAKVAKHMLDFNDKEIELVGGNCLNKLTMEEPFLTVTLREFLYYKSLEREVSAHKYLENYYQKMSLTVFEELLNTGTILGNFIKFNNYIYKCLHDRDGTTEYIEAKQNEILSPLYGGDISLKVSSTELDQPDFPSTQLLQEMWDLMRNPVVEYEPSNEPTTDTETWENQALDRDNDLSSGGVQSTALRSISTDTMIEANCVCTAKQTTSLESSETATSSSNDILTIHHPKKYVSVESLLERGTTARTVPFSAVASEDNSESDDAKTRATTATDFEEAIQYSNSNLLQYMHTEMKRSGKSSSRSKKSSKVSRPTTTVVSKAQLSFYGPTSKQIQQPWIQNGGDMNLQDENFYSSGSSINVGDHDMKSGSGLFNNAEVQVSEVDLVSCNSVRPLTFCYPNNYSNTRILPFDPGQGDR